MTETALQEAKRAARAEAVARRRAAHEDAAHRFGEAGAGEALRRRFLEAITVPDGAAVSGYWPVRSEIDTRPLLAALHEAGHVCGLPVIVRRGAALVFRRWQPGMDLLQRPFGLLEPGPEAGEVIPDVALVPLLAFDAAGRRLGYGGGYYDRTLAGLRRAGREVLAVGVAYAAQACDHVPADDGDERLDWVVTEQGAIRFGERRWTGGTGGSGIGR
jgi:5-formyltetrahydrofolate cyclo-ligase